MQAIEREAAARPAAAAARRRPRRSGIHLASLFSPALLPRMIVGIVVLIAINTLIFGFVNGCRPSSCSRESASPGRFAYTLVIVRARWSAAPSARSAPIVSAAGAPSSGPRSLTIVLGAIYPFVLEPALLLTVGFLLIVSIYVQAAMLFGVYTPNCSRPRCGCAPTASATRWAAARPSSRRSSSRAVQGLRRRRRARLDDRTLVVQIIVVALWGIEPAKRPARGTRGGAGKRERQRQPDRRARPGQSASPLRCDARTRYRTVRAADRSSANTSTFTPRSMSTSRPFRASRMISRSIFMSSFLIT